MSLLDDIIEANRNQDTFRHLARSRDLVALDDRVDAADAALGARLDALELISTATWRGNGNHGGLIGSGSRVLWGAAVTDSSDGTIWERSADNLSIKMLRAGFVIIDAKASAYRDVIDGADSMYEGVIRRNTVEIQRVKIRAKGAVNLQYQPAALGPVATAVVANDLIDLLLRDDLSAHKQYSNGDSFANTITLTYLPA